MEEGFGVIKDAKENFSDPDAIAQADAKLQALGYDNLEDFMDKVSSQFDSLKIARKEID